MLKREQRLFEALHRFPVRRAHSRFATDLTTVYQSLFPPLAAQGVVCELLDVGDETISPETLDGLHDASMQHAPLPLQETTIGHIMGERMFEGIGRLGIQARLVQEFCLLQVRKAPTECI